MSGFDEVVEAVDLSNVMISTVQYPHNIRVNWVQAGVYDRVVRGGETGELWVRMVPRKAVPVGGKVVLQLPLGFTLPINSVPSCSVRYSSLYNDAFPRWQQRPNPHTPLPCSLTNSNFTLIYPSVIPKEWSGTGTKCTWLFLSSTGGSSPGLVTPVSPGNYSVQVSTYDNAMNWLETGTALVLLRPSLMPNSLKVENVIRTSGVRSILKLAFTTGVALPKGYISFINGVPQNYTTIEIEMETYESYRYDLAMNYQVGSEIPCQAITGFTAIRPIRCQFYPGDMIQTTPLPAKVLISGFEAISMGTALEVHFPGLTNPGVPPNVPADYQSYLPDPVDGDAYRPFQPKIAVSVYTTDYQGLRMLLYDSTKVVLDPETELVHFAGPDTLMRISRQHSIALKQGVLK